MIVLMVGYYEKLYKMQHCSKFTPSFGVNLDAALLQALLQAFITSSFSKSSQIFLFALKGVCNQIRVIRGW